MRLPKIDRILLADGELQPILAKARDIRALGGLIDGFFPPDLARQVRVSNLRDGELVLAAANPSAAAKIRLLSPSLCRFLEERRRQVNSVSIRVQPTLAHAHNPLPALQKSAKLSTSGLAHLRALFEGMSDSPARHALGELLAHQDPAGPPKGSAAAPRKEAAGRPTRRKGPP